MLKPIKAEGAMLNDEQQLGWDEKRLEDVLYSDTDPVSKVQQIVDLGYDEEVASEIVERYQIGQHTPVYYERLDFEDEE